MVINFLIVWHAHCSECLDHFMRGQTFQKLFGNGPPLVDSTSCSSWIMIA